MESESESSIYTDSDYYDGDDGEEESLPRNCKPRWLRPAPAPACRPVHGDDPASPPHPERVLVDTLAHIDGQRDATTAGAARANGHSIQVTFRIARAPRLSHLAVQCPDAFRTLPRVVATQDDLALLRVPNDHRLGNEFFVYRAGAGGQSTILRMIPNPDTLYYADKDVGILSCHNAADRFVIAVSNQTLCRPRYIHLFDSETWAWSTKKVRLKPSKAFSYTRTSKVIAMGGKRGAMGWVDLWRGILVCDVLRAGKDDDDKVRYIPLPSRKYAFWGLPETVRDIAVVNGVVRFFAMYRRGVYSTNLGGAWHADTWTMKRPWKKWQHELHLKASEIRVDDPRHSELLGDLPEHKDDDDRKKSLLTRLRAGSPVLSQDEDHVVYILTKPMFQEDKAWVITLDMNTKTLRAMDEFDAGRTDGLMFTCAQS